MSELSLKVHSETNKLDETIDRLALQLRTFRQEQLAAQEAQDERGSELAEIVLRAPIGSADKWREVRTTWTEAKRRMQQRIDTIKETPARKKYSDFSRNSYVDIIEALLRDGKISYASKDKLLQMNQRFLQLRRRVTDTTDEDVSLFRRLLDETAIDLLAKSDP